MRQAILFDDGLRTLAPLTDLRPSFEVRSGALTNRERVERLLGIRTIGVLVPEDKRALTAEATGLATNGLVPRVAVGGESPLLINGACVLPPVDLILGLRAGQWLLERETGEVIAAGLEPDVAAAAPVGVPRGAEVIEHDGRVVLSRPWHVRTFRDEALRIDLELLSEQNGGATLDGVTVFGEHPLTVRAGARVYPGAVLDLEGGPIVLDEGAVVRPRATVIGPAYIGARTVVSDGALIKANTAIGPRCKVGGEIGGTIFQGFANKVHDGHLGDSWVGEWANFGAGTVNSNLLNTYQEVIARAAPGEAAECTGEVFLGCIVGDHAKFSIGTRIMTGAIVGTGVMWASAAPVNGCVAAFSWMTDAARTTYRLEKFVDVARAVMARRGVEPGRAYLDRVSALHRHALTGGGVSA